MTVYFRIEMVIVAILFTIFVIRSVNKNYFLPKNAVVWLFVAFSLILFSVFPSIPEVISHFLGFKETSNFLYFCGMFCLLIYSISLSISNSKQENKIVRLVQEVSLLKKRMDDESKK